MPISRFLSSIGYSISFTGVPQGLKWVASPFQVVGVDVLCWAPAWQLSQMTNCAYTLQQLTTVK